MPANSFTHFVFVDFENVQKVDLGLVEGQPVHVTLLIGKKQTWLDLSLVQQIHRVAAQVELVEVGASGHNALDLTLACYLGQTVQRSPGAEYCIVSKDKDFDAMIAHLQAKRIRVSRHESFAGLPFLSAKRSGPSKPPFAVPKPAPRAAAPNKAKSAAVRFDKFVQHLRNSPPANRTKLEHMIEAYFKPALPVGGKKGVIADLLKGQIIEIDPAGKVKVS